MANQPTEDLQIVLLDEQHDRGSFTCGVVGLDRYLKTQAGQDVRRNANAVFVLCGRGEPARILGYYTLCAMAISQGDVPETARKHILRHPLVSATLIGRLAVSKDRQVSGWARSCSPTRCSALSRALARLAPRWSWSMRSTKVRPASTPARIRAIARPAPASAADAPCGWEC